MAQEALKIDARRKKILEILSRDGQVIVSQLSAELGATTVTIRNDLDALERDGYLERVQGGALQKLQNLYQLESRGREMKNAEEKKRIAGACAACVHDGATLFINSGTTTFYTAVALKEHKNLNVVTNSLKIAVELGGVASFRVILLGGEINAQYTFSCGGDAQEQLRRYKADFAILSLDGVSAAGGITTYHADECVIDKMMLEQAKHTIVVADHDKMGHEGFSLICDAQSVGTLITDDACPQEAAEEIEALGVRVLRV